MFGVLRRPLAVLALATVFVTAVAVNSSVPELGQRKQFPMTSLQFAYTPDSAISNSAAGSTYSMDLTSNPILATLPGVGLSSKVDNFGPCSIKIPHIHPRASKYSYVATGTLTVGIAEEDTGRINEYSVPEGSAIVVPQGLLHFMKNEDCANPLKMLTTFNNVDAGELTMLDKIFGFDDATVMAATGLNLATVNKVRSSLPTGAGDLRIDPVCQAKCNGNLSVAPTAAQALAG